MNIVSLKSAPQLSEKQAQARAAEWVLAVWQHTTRIVPRGSSVEQVRHWFEL